MSVTPPEPPAESSAEPPSEPPKRQGSAWTKAAVGAAVVALAVVLFVVLRPDDDDEADSTPAAQTTTEETTSEETTTEDATTEEETTEETTTEEEETTTEENPNAPQRIVVTVRNGQPVGGVQRPEVERNAEVLLIVRADVEDEAHLHGYDLAADVAPGQAARIRFQADTQGVFELELEDRALMIAELEVH